jgi:MFS transporter, ACS family, tartrate transporter
MYTVSEVLFDRRLIGLNLVYFGVVASNCGLSLFCRRSSRHLGSIFPTTLVSAAPYSVGVIVWWDRRLDRAAGEAVLRPSHCSLRPPASSWLCFALIQSLKTLAFCTASLGILACLPVVWT